MYGMWKEKQLAKFYGTYTRALIGNIYIYINIYALGNYISFDMHALSKGCFYGV